MARKPASRTTKGAAATAARQVVAARPVLQWIGAGIGVLVTLGSIGVILAEAMAPARPVSFATSIRSARQTSTGWIAEIEVANKGSTAASAVTLQAEMEGASAVATLDYVPGDGEAIAFLQLPTDPRAEPSSIVVTGWSGP